MDTCRFLPEQADNDPQTWGIWDTKNNEPYMTGLSEHKAKDVAETLNLNAHLVDCE